MFTTRVSIFISLITFALLGNIVTAEKAFVLTAYYNILRQTMTVFFPQGIAQFAETLVSLKRIQKYMMYDETKNNKTISELLDIQKKTDDAITENGNDVEIIEEKRNSALLSEPGIYVNNVKARWDENNSEYTLNNVNLRVQPGTLVAIIGPVGSGKSSLIQAILKELPVESGSIEVNGVVSYASQEPWLFSGTVRSNILFGLPMNKDRYRNVIKRCALERDFTLLPNGDKTIVGERGQSLSGGQKARISLARACYRNAAVYLLDDPLSAVDTHVGKHLFDQCVRGLLREKVVILVTHQLHYLQHVDQIVILSHGKVEAVGSYDSLRESGLDFAKLLESSGEEKGETDSLQRTRSSSKLRRQSSDASNASLEEDQTTDAKPADEARQQGKIGLSVYGKYFKSGGGLCFFYLTAMFFILAQILASGGDYYLTYWFVLFYISFFFVIVFYFCVLFLQGQQRRSKTGTNY